MININKVQTNRLEELEANTARTPQEEALRLALVDLEEKTGNGSTPAEIEAAKKVAVEAEAATKA